METTTRAQLGTIADFFADGDWIESKDQSHEGFRLVQTGNVGVGAYLDKKERAKFVSADTFKRLQCTEIFAGDVLVSRLPDPVGRACILPDIKQRAITAVDCSIIRFNSLACEARYFIHFTRSQDYAHQISQFLAGSTRVRISRRNLQTVELPLPPLAEQRRIAAKLDAICEIVDKRGGQLAKLDQLVKSRFVEMFGDLQTNNKGWSIAPFEDAATIDGTLEKDFKRYADYPHIGIDSIAKGTGELVGYRTVAQDGVISGKYHFTAKHIIYSKIRPNFNKVALPDFEGLCSADAYAILPTEKADRVYLAYVLRSQFFLDYIIPLSGRTGMPKANRKQIQGFEFPLPPLALQREFAAFVAEVDKSKFVLRETVVRMETLYKAKLQEYFG